MGDKEKIVVKMVWLLVPGEIDDLENCRSAKQKFL